ncbi:MAG: hydrogenase maturation protease [Candidatus Sabulitectum sp.]|nr:hydrogenase maturation protease [Candidatus Sabulitectum sp.]
MCLQGKNIPTQKILKNCPAPAKITFIGIGNTLAGDDGAGMVMLWKLRRRIGDVPGVAFREIPGDMYEIWDILPGTESMVFLDAVAGEIPGIISAGKTLPRAFFPSFHQADLCSVVASLATLYDGEFPPWILWGVTIHPPRMLGEGLSDVVEYAVDKAVTEIVKLLRGNGLPIGRLLVKI